jgi:hypothetical protein
MKIKILLLLYILLLINDLQGQRFFGSIVGGVNFAQIEGDNSAGFNKRRFSFGIKLDYPISPAVDLTTELLYSGRGAKGKVNELDINLNYIEIPFLVAYRDWYIEDKKYDKVRIEGGLSYGYLFSVTNSNTPIAVLAQNASKHDISFVGGVAYMFTPNLGLNLKYTRSFLRIVKNPILENDGFLSYFTTLRLEYHF